MIATFTSSQHIGIEIAFFWIIRMILYYKEEANKAMFKRKIVQNIK